MKNAHFFLPFLMLLTACHPTDKTPASTAKATETQASSVANTVSATVSVPTAVSTVSSTTSALTADGKIQIDWQKIDTGEPVVDKHKFAYKFAPDSVPVQNYAKAYQVDSLTAQYNLTIGMGANEPLDKVLDQIGTSYVSHELTAGKESKLIIHTTPKVLPSEHDVVLTDPFAKGLVLPVQIIPDGKKS